MAFRLKFKLLRAAHKYFNLQTYLISMLYNKLLLIPHIIYILHFHTQLLNILFLLPKTPFLQTVNLTNSYSFNKIQESPPL